MQAADAVKNHPEWILTAGGDTHLPKSVCWSGIETSIRITDEKTLVKILKSGDYDLII